MKPHKFSPYTALLGALFLLVSGCGYSAGSLNKTGVSKLFIPVFRSTVYEPNLGVLVTGTVVKGFQTDGTMRITNKEDADATLLGTITKFDLTPARIRIEDEKTVREYHLNMEVSYTVTKKGETRPYTSGTVNGGTSFFIGDDLVNDKRQGVSYVAEDVAKKLASCITESW